MQDQHQQHTPADSAPAKTPSLTTPKWWWVRQADGHWQRHSWEEFLAAQQEDRFQQDGAARHLGIITQRVSFWYRRLPLPAKIAYDFEDMVSEVALHVCAQADKYTACKAKESTWVYYVADNYCREIRQRYHRAMRNAEVVALEAELSIEVQRQLSCESFLRKRQAFDGVERLIEASSDAVRDLIEVLLSGRARYRKDLPPKARNAIGELRLRARQQHVTFDDFLLVYRSV